MHKVTTLAGSVVGIADGPVFNATFNGPYGIVIDFAGVNLFVTCLTAKSIRQVVIATGYVTTLAGAGVLLQPKYARRIF